MHILSCHGDKYCGMGTWKVDAFVLTNSYSMFSCGARQLFSRYLRSREAPKRQGTYTPLMLFYFTESLVYWVELFTLRSGPHLVNAFKDTSHRSQSDWAGRSVIAAWIMINISAHWTTNSVVTSHHSVFFVFSVI